MVDRQGDSGAHTYCSHHEGGNHDTCFTWSCGRGRGLLPVSGTQASGTGWNPPKTSFQVGLEWWHETWHRHPWGRGTLGGGLASILPVSSTPRSRATWSRPSSAEPSDLGRGKPSQQRCFCSWFTRPGVLPVSSLKSCHLLFLPPGGLKLSNKLNGGRGTMKMRESGEALERGPHNLDQRTASCCSPWAITESWCGPL